MNSPMPRHLFCVALASAALGFADLSQAQMTEDLPTTELEPTDATGIPEDISGEDWMQASGTLAIADPVEDVDVDVLVLAAEDLVPEGTYTVWWSDAQAVLTPVAGLGTGPEDDLPENAFTADEQGNAVERFLAATNQEEYDQLVVALHHGEEVEDVEDLADAVFQHLQGPLPER